MAKSKVALTGRSTKHHGPSLDPQELRDRIASVVALDDGEIRDHLYLTWLDEGPSARQILEISCVAPARDQAVAILHEVTQSADRWIVESAATGRDDSMPEDGTTAEIRESKATEALSHASLDSFLTEHFAVLADAAEKTRRQLPNQSDAGSSNDNIESQQLDQLRRKLGAAEDQKRNLLEQRTQNHPAVQQLALDIKQLKKSLASVQHEPGAADPLSNQSTGQSDAADPAALPIDQAVLAAAVQRFDKLRESYNEERRSFENSLRTAIDQPAQTEQAQASSWTVIEPAQTAIRLGGTPSIGRVAVLALISVAIGAVFTWLAGGLPTGDTIAEAAEIEHRFGLPVIGTLSLRKLSPGKLARGKLARGKLARGKLARGNLARGGRVARTDIVLWTTRGCELVLGLLVFALLITAMIDSPLAVSLADDPFGTISETIARATTF